MAFDSATPRTEPESGNATLVQAGQDLENLENDSISPIKRRDDIVSLMRNERAGGRALKTPNLRQALSERQPNLPGKIRESEFTPLLHSVTKKNAQMRQKQRQKNAGFGTPGKNKATLSTDHVASPALPNHHEISATYGHGSDFGSSFIGAGAMASTPMPNISDSSAQSTPLAIASNRVAPALIAGDGQVMTLKEQENAIERVSKENWSLKLHIHFLDDLLKKTHPDFNEAAVQENTDLKINRAHLQIELKRCRKTLSEAEHDIEMYKKHMEELQAKAKAQLANRLLVEEVEQLRQSTRVQAHELEAAEEKIDKAQNKEREVRDELEDMQADTREKERRIDELEEMLENVGHTDQGEKDRLDAALAKIQVLQDREEDLDDRLKQRESELVDAMKARQIAEADLAELRDEMSNKSFTTKGLTRQTEERNARLEEDLENQQEAYRQLQKKHDEAVKQIEQLQKGLSKGDKLEQIHAECIVKMQDLEKELQSKADEKDLLHSRHDALSAQSRQLEQEANRAKLTVERLEKELQSERQHSQSLERHHDEQSKQKTIELESDIESLQRLLDTQNLNASTDRKRLEGQIQRLQDQKIRAEESSNNLKQTVDRLREDLNSRSPGDFKFRDALKNEQQQSRDREIISRKQIASLEESVERQGNELVEEKIRLVEIKDQLRNETIRRQELERKSEGLEDEIEVLQAEAESHEHHGPSNDSASQARASTLQRELIKVQNQLDDALAELEGTKHSPKDELLERIASTEHQLATAKADKERLYDRLATHRNEMHKKDKVQLELEAEKNRLRSQLDLLHQQLDDTFRMDRERKDVNSGSANVEELNVAFVELKHERDELKQRFEDASRQAQSKEENLRDQLSDLRRQLRTVTPDTSHESSLLSRKVLRLEAQIEQLEQTIVAKTAQQSEAASELDRSHKTLSDQKKQSERQKLIIQELEDHVADLELRVQESQRSTHKTICTTTAHEKLQRELDSRNRELELANSELRDVENKHRNEARILRSRLAEADQVADKMTELQTHRDESQRQASEYRKECDARTDKEKEANEHIRRLQDQLHSVERDLRRAKAAASAIDSTGTTSTSERAQLHRMLKDAKLEAEDLRLQMQSNKYRSSDDGQEKSLEKQVRQLTEARNLEILKSGALSLELEALQSRYQRAIDNIGHQQRGWDDERKLMSSHVRYESQPSAQKDIVPIDHQSGPALGHPGQTTNRSRSDETQRKPAVPSTGEITNKEPVMTKTIAAVNGRKLTENEANLRFKLELERVDKKHAAEVRMLNNKAAERDASLRREVGFKEALVQEKRYLLKEVEMYKACNKVDLDILQSMGVTPPTYESVQSMRHRMNEIVRRVQSGKQGSLAKSSDKFTTSHARPLLRTVGLAIMAVHRMRRSALTRAVDRQNKHKQPLTQNTSSHMSTNFTQGWRSMAKGRSDAIPPGKTITSNKMCITEDDSAIFTFLD